MTDHARITSVPGALSKGAWATLLDDARSHSAWLDEAIPEDDLRELQRLVFLGPTSLNCEPLRITFLTTPASRERLRPALLPGNVEKAMTAPVVAILASDLDFHSHLDNYLSHKPVAELLRAN